VTAPCHRHGSPARAYGEQTCGAVTPPQPEKSAVYKSGATPVAASLSVRFFPPGGVMTRKLRAVSPGEKAPRKKSVTEAAACGTHLELLAALRDRVAAAVADPNCPPRDLAALTRRLQEIAKEIAVLDAAEAGAVSVPATTPDESWMGI
jgi:hypothetical protein